MVTEKKIILGLAKKTKLSLNHAAITSKSFGAAAYKSSVSKSLVSKLVANRPEATKPEVADLTELTEEVEEPKRDIIDFVVFDEAEAITS